MSSTVLHALHIIESDKHAVGNLNNWNVDKKKFVICNNGADANYANAGNKYVVAFSDGLVLGGQKIIRLEIDNEN